MIIDNENLLSQIPSAADRGLYDAVTEYDLDTHLWASFGQASRARSHGL